MRREPHLAAVREHDRALGQILFAILRALDVNVGTNAFQQRFGRAFAELDDDVDAAQRAQQALRDRQMERSAGARP